MRSKSSFQGKVRVIAISLGIILIVGGCSSSFAEKDKSEGKDDFYSGLLMSVSEDQKMLIVSGLECTDVYTMQ
jgi:uncharacterized protein YceK